MKISVYVTSVNDNAPVLKNLPAAVSVREDAKIGTKIAGCTIYDGDFNWDGSGGLGGIARVEIKSKLIICVIVWIFVSRKEYFSYQPLTWKYTTGLRKQTNNNIVELVICTKCIKITK